MAEILCTDDGPGIKKKMIQIIKAEMLYPESLSYEFDLSADGVEFKPVFYGANLTFYNLGRRANKTVITVQSFMSWLKRDRPAIYKTLTEDLPSNPQFTTWVAPPLDDESTSTDLALRLIYTGFHPKKKKIDPGDILGESYADFYEKFKRDIAKLDKTRVHIGSRVSFVTGALGPDSAAHAIKTDGIFYFAVDKDEQLLALSHVMYFSRPKSLEVLRVASMIPGGCKALSSGMAAAFIRGGTRYVKIESISNPAHLCYLKSYFGVFKYAFLERITSHFFALVDSTTYDVWLNRSNSAFEPGRIELHGTIYMRYVADVASLQEFTSNDDFKTYTNNSGACMEVYCDVNEAVAQVIDHFISLGKRLYGTDWNTRVFIISRADEYRAKFPKRQKLSEEGEEDD
jgi:hypothetical protein